MDKPQNSEFREKGVKVVGADITGPREKLVELMRDVDAVITPIYFTALEQQKILADAAKEAGAKRFIPSNFGPVMPPTAMKMRERVSKSDLSFTPTPRIIVLSPADTDVRLRGAPRNNRRRR